MARASTADVDAEGVAGLDGDGQVAAVGEAQPVARGSRTTTSTGKGLAFSTVTGRVPCRDVRLRLARRPAGRRRRPSRERLLDGGHRCVTPRRDGVVVARAVATCRRRSSARDEPGPIIASKESSWPAAASTRRGDVRRGRARAGPTLLHRFGAARRRRVARGRGRRPGPATPGRRAGRAGGTGAGPASRSPGRTSTVAAPCRRPPAPRPGAGAGGRGRRGRRRRRRPPVRQLGRQRPGRRRHPAGRPALDRSRAGIEERGQLVVVLVQVGSVGAVPGPGSRRSRGPRAAGRRRRRPVGAGPQARRAAGRHRGGRRAARRPGRGGG